MLLLGGPFAVASGPLSCSKQFDSPQAEPGPSAVSFTVDAGTLSGDANTSSGTVMPLTFTATGTIGGTSSGLPGVPLAFSAVPSSVSVSPPAASTDRNGNATTYALIPYNAQGTITVGGAGFSTGPLL